MAGNVATLTFAGDAGALQRAAARATQSTKDVAASVTTAGDDMRAAAADSQRYTDRLGSLGAATAGVSAGFTEAGSSLQTLVDFQDRGRSRAAAHARALAAVEQAALDANQAQVDLKQSTRDLAQSQLDIEQAQIDARQAQKDYSAAVTEFGKNSIEAAQAQLDLKQAQEDVNQASLDAEQAQVAGAQATRDAKDAQLDLNDAQREANPSALSKAASDLQSYADVAGSVAGTVGLLAMAYQAVNVAAIRAAAGTAAMRIAQIAGAVATGIATVAQWALNVALTANPIGIIIVAIGALIAIIIVIATKTDWFQKIWKVAWGAIKTAAGAVWSWLKDTAGKVWDFLLGLPGKLKTAFTKLSGYITAPFRAAFNYVAKAWNSTVGSLSWTVPTWVPGLGGSSVSAPRLPTYHTGGRVPGLPSQQTLAVLAGGETVSRSGDSGQAVQIVLRGDGTRVGELLLAVLREAIDLRGGDPVTVLGGRG